MDSEPKRHRVVVFRVHVTLFVLGAVLGALGVGGTWRGGVAAAGVCWVVAGVLALVGRRSVLVPTALRAAQDHGPDPARRAEVERASAIMTGLVLILVGGTTTALGWAYLVSG